MGEWLRNYGETVYGTTAGDIPTQEWGVTTRKGERLYIHIMNLDATELFLPLECKVMSAVVYGTQTPVKMKRSKDGVTLQFDSPPTGVDYIVELVTK
jgi:alpha-L-fucosidase